MAATPNYALPLPADSTYVKDVAAVIRDSNTATDSVLKTQETAVNAAKSSAAASATSAAQAASLASAPPDTAVAALVNAAGTTSTKTALQNMIKGYGAPWAKDGHEYAFLAGVIRNDGAGFQLLTEASNHRPINLGTITTGTSTIRVNYPALNADTTILFMAVPDETLAAEGIILGTSVTPDYTDISISQVARGVSDYISYNGTSWVSQDGVFTGITFSAGTITLNHEAIPLNSQYAVNLTPRGGGYVFSVGGGSSPTGSTSMKIEVRDMAGAIVSTPNTNMRFYLSRGGGTRKVDPSTLTTALYPLSNIWLFGIMGMD